MIKTDYCARCYYLGFIQINSKEHFLCLKKHKEIKEIPCDDISDCKDFDYQEHKELEEQIKKDLELLYNIESNR